MQEPVKLNLGCGANHLEGWVNIDAVASFNPDLLHDLTRPLPFEDQSVDEILAEDLLEHFDKYMRCVVLYDWARVLKPRGMLTLRVPNFKRLLLRGPAFTFDQFVDLVFAETMLQGTHYLGSFGSHKWGYSMKSLVAFTRLFGLEPVEKRAGKLNLYYTGNKLRHLSRDEFLQLEVVSASNSDTPSEGRLSMQEILTAIETYDRQAPGDKNSDRA